VSTKDFTDEIDKQWKR